MLPLPSVPSRGSFWPHTGRSALPILAKPDSRNKGTNVDFRRACYLPPFRSQDGTAPLHPPASARFPAPAEPPPRAARTMAIRGAVMADKRTGASLCVPRERPKQGGPVRRHPRATAIPLPYVCHTFARPWISDCTGPDFCHIPTFAATRFPAGAAPSNRPDHAVSKGARSGNLHPLHPLKVVDPQRFARDPSQFDPWWLRKAHHRPAPDTALETCPRSATPEKTHIASAPTSFPRS